MFQGFTDETIQFMWGIRFNNRRDWFLQHKPVYLSSFYEPMKELAAEVQQKMLQKYRHRQPRMDGGRALGLRADAAVRLA